MVNAQTVFVFGAGASAPYGFPLGRRLVKEIVSHVGEGELITRLAQNEIEPDQITRFREEFPQADRNSIDAFLEARPEFNELGKLAIAWELMRYEEDNNLYLANNDWYSYLLNHLLGPKPDDFKKNDLKVITFNFDRSFERRLFLTLRANYGLSEPAASELCEHVEVLHVHGQLGLPSWLPSSSESDDARPYVAERSSSEVARCAAQIQIISDDIPEDRLKRARAWLQGAARVCFIGFGYHPINLSRLATHKLGNTQVVRGTVLDVPAGELEPIKSAFQKIHLHPFDALRFLEETDVIHGTV